MANIFTKLPSIGDAVVGKIASGEVLFITADSFDNSALSAEYERIGVVYARHGKEVKIAYKENASKAWAGYGWHTISGTLDGTAHSGIISMRAASNSWNANIDKTINYTASTPAELAAALNTAFAADSDFTAQEWEAHVEGENVVITYKNTSWQQFSYNTAKNGLTMSSALPDVAALAKMRRRNGNEGGEGAISSMPRALAYFRADNSSTTYNPASDVTSIKTTYPICLPAYLGTSQYQSDHCALLRATYGEGEDGWLRYMEAQLAVNPTDQHVMGMRDGHARTKALAAYKTANGTACCAAADYCINKTTACIKEWYLPTTEDLADLLAVIKYGTDSSRTADKVNATLQKMGGSAISNGTNLWSCIRYYAHYAWFANGYHGFFNGYYMCGTLTCLPTSLYRIA